MKTIAVFFYVLTTVFFLLFSYSCRNNSQKIKNDALVDSAQWNIDTVLAEKDVLLNGILGNTYQSVGIDSSDYIILPLAAPLLRREGKEEKTYYSSGSYKEGSEYWNLIFYNSKTMESYLLDTGKLFIRQLHVNNLETYGRFADGIILYTITVKDFNGNGQLGYDDPTYLYMSDKSGKNLTRLSPENADVVSWEFPKKNNFILMKIKYDLNKDTEFDEKDPSSLIRVDIDSVITQTPLLNQAIENDIKRLFKKYYSDKKDSTE